MMIHKYLHPELTILKKNNDKTGSKKKLLKNMPFRPIILRPNNMKLKVLQYRNKKLADVCIIFLNMFHRIFIFKNAFMFYIIFKIFRN